MARGNPFDGKLANRLFVALVTPWNPDETLDEEGFRRLLRYFIKQHEQHPDLALIVNPEAGEVFYLSPKEQLRVISVAIDEVAGALPVFTGLLGNSTKDLVEIATAISKTKVDGLFLMPPIGSMDITIAWDAAQYPEVWADMIEAVVEAAPQLPILCHPTASITPAYGTGLPKEATLAILERFPQVIGWKMTYNYEGHRKISRAIRSLPRHVGILGAAALYFHENLASGDFDGTVTGSFNYALEPMLVHIEAWRRGDVEQARKIWIDGGLAELQEFIYETFGRLHVRYKIATWLRGHIDSPFMRAPMPKPRKVEIETIYSIFSRMDVSLIPRAEVEQVLNVLYL